MFHFYFTRVHFEYKYDFFSVNEAEIIKKNVSLLVLFFVKMGLFILTLLIEFVDVEIN